MANRIYNPLNWFWLASDGRVFSSAKRVTVTAVDADYLAWVAQGNAATPWPRDTSGVQSSAELSAVLAPFGIVVS